MQFEVWDQKGQRLQGSKVFCMLRAYGCTHDKFRTTIGLINISTLECDLFSGRKEVYDMYKLTFWTMCLYTYEIVIKFGAWRFRWGVLCRPAAKCKSLRGRLFQVRSKFAKRGTTGLGWNCGSRRGSATNKNVMVIYMHAAVIIRIDFNLIIIIWTPSVSHSLIVD
jgi:hypothetical protein